MVQCRSSHCHVIIWMRSLPLSVTSLRAWWRSLLSQLIHMYGILAVGRKTVCAVPGSRIGRLSGTVPPSSYIVRRFGLSSWRAFSLGASTSRFQSGIVYGSGACATPRCLTAEGPHSHARSVPSSSKQQAVAVAFSGNCYRLMGGSSCCRIMIAMCAIFRRYG